MLFRDSLFMQKLIDQSIEVLELAEERGFYWPSLNLLFDNVKDEVREIQEAFDQNESKERLVEETGDLLFGAIEICRNLDVNPREALEIAFQKFKRRFEIMLETLESHQKNDLNDLSIAEKMALWRHAKEIHANE